MNPGGDGAAVTADRTGLLRGGMAADSLGLADEAARTGKNPQTRLAPIMRSLSSGSEVEMVDLNLVPISPGSLTSASLGEYSCSDGVDQLQFVPGSRSAPRADLYIGFDSWDYEYQTKKSGSVFVEDAIEENLFAPGCVLFATANWNLSFTNVEAPIANGVSPAQDEVVPPGPVSFSWGGADAFTDAELIYGTNPNPTESNSTVVSADFASASVSGIPEGSVIYWTVKLIDVRDNSVVAYSPVQSFMTQFPPPSPPTLSGSVQNGLPNLTWSSVAGAASYRVERVLVPGNGGAQTAYEGSATSYTDWVQVTSLGSSLNSVTYFVRAVAPDGTESERSNNVTYRRPNP